ncbi:hypothetical protein BJI49_12650 [Acetobacter pasteurianus]|nr:hypothetical protein [Acetobacter pasteurianus]RCL04685.1 hypothetical protein BJI49_12650 [Acetobacter pasteurianus]GAB32127.1 hypothetical protein APS_2729 [Acetobacter pasteurianus subsp. pasteurianus LMG 1262 = NBRC 106471]GCD50348.1 hypothetical protein NBRC106471_1904 [Acetobacter pasteurianus subsp. pasteurianus LMG 1262 = NBRC 106471]
MTDCHNVLGAELNRILEEAKALLHNVGSEGMSDSQKRNSRDVDPICMISVADCGSSLLQVNNASQDAPVLDLDAKQTWLLARLLYIMQEFQNGADANKEFRYLLRDLAQNAWPTMSCDHVMGMDYQDRARGCLATVYGLEKPLRPEDIGTLNRHEFTVGVPAQDETQAG